MTSAKSRQALAANLVYYIKTSGANQRDLAAICDVSEATVSDWCNARKYPRIDKIEKMANFFQIKMSDLIEERKPNMDGSLSPDRRFLLDAVRTKLTDDQVHLVRQLVEEVLRRREQ